MPPIGEGQGAAIMLSRKRRLLAFSLNRCVHRTARTSFMCFASTLLWSPASATEWPDFPFPDRARVVIVGEDISINGLPTKIWELSSAQAPEEILSYYRKEWRNPAVPNGPGYIEEEAGGWQIISRSEDPYLYTVQVAESAMGSSKGFLAVSMPMELGEPVAFAMPAGSEILSDVISDDAGKSGRVVQFKNSQSIEANYNFYLNRYLADGWAELSHLPADRNKALLLMNKGSGKVSIVFNRLDNESYGVLVESHD